MAFFEYPIYSGLLELRQRPVWHVVLVRQDITLIDVRIFNFGDAFSKKGQKFEIVVRIIHIMRGRGGKWVSELSFLFIVDHGDCGKAQCTSGLARKTCLGVRCPEAKQTQIKDGGWIHSTPESRRIVARYRKLPRPPGQLALAWDKLSSTKYHYITAAALFVSLTSLLLIQWAQPSGVEV